MNKYIAFLFFALVCFACNEPKQPSKQAAAEPTAAAEKPWWADANIYEVNTRQYTKEGTFEAFETHLDRLNDLGVDILWFMPLQPVGKLNRKGSLGSYYSISDYTAINPEYGTDEDFKSVVEAAHARGMKVILDWVANHTAWDHQWISEHPTWYSADKNGKRPIVPVDENGVSTDWTDVADLNYDNAEMRKAMIGDMLYWIEKYDIDGFRCDVAHWVPVDFWKAAIKEIKAKKPTAFMLAESDFAPNVNDGGFDMDYGWHFHHLINQVAKKKEDVNVFCSMIDSLPILYKKGAIKMNFTTNHDENSWNGTIEERLGKAGDAMAVLAFTIDGMPLIYSGQEVSLNKRLAFFEKDEIDWKGADKSAFYAKLLTLKKNNPALWNGTYGGHPEFNHCENGVISYTRKKDNNEVFVAINFGDDAATIKNPGLSNKVAIRHGVKSGKDELEIQPNGYIVFTK